MREITISRKEADRRLDKYLMKYMNAAPAGFIYKMLRKKRIKLNSKRAAGSETLREGDIITLYLSDDTIAFFTASRALPTLSTNPSINEGLDIIFEDEDILLINKPAGILVHSDSNKFSDSSPGKFPYTSDLTSLLIHYLNHILCVNVNHTTFPCKNQTHSVSIAS